MLVVAQLYQRFQPFWDRAVPSAGLALLLWASAEATGAYPSEWRLFLSACLFILGLGWPWIAYTAFTFVIAYPLYLISIYMAAIVLAALVLTSRWAMRNLGATVLVLITPALLPAHLEAAVPLLAGLWWGEQAGALAGGLAALWLKLLAGMAGQPLDLSQLSGWMPASTDIVARFRGFNSLQTVLGLVNPFAETSQVLLLHVLQVVAWALAGYLAGLLVRRTQPDRWRVWSPLLASLPASLVIWAGYTLVPRMLFGLSDDRNPLGVWLLGSALLAALARMAFLYLRRPIVRPLRRTSASRRAVKPFSEPAPSTAPISPSPENKPAVQWTPGRRAARKTDADDDVIMLEID